MSQKQRATEFEYQVAGIKTLVSQEPSIKNQVLLTLNALTFNGFNA